MHSRVVAAMIRMLLMSWPWFLARCALAAALHATVSFAAPSLSTFLLLILRLVLTPEIVQRGQCRR